VPGLYACGEGSLWSAIGTGGSGGSAVSIQEGGTVVGSRATLDFIAGQGILNAISDTGTQINIQQNADTGFLLSRAQEQAGSDISLSCNSGSGTAYACSTNGNTLQAYTAQARFAWKPDVSCGVTPTINISVLGAVPLYRSDGSAIQAGDCTAGAQVTIWFDETANVAATTTATASSGSTALTVASATGILAGQWISGTGIASGTRVSGIAGSAVTLSQATTAALSASNVTFTAGGFKLTAPYNPGFANPLTTEGDVLYEHSGAASRLALGTQYQVLQAGAADPVYGAVNLTQSAAVTGVLSAANGGTGVNNGANTLTLGGNLTTSGAFATTLSVTGATSLTLPASGTLMTTANSVALAQTPLTALGDMLYVNSTPALARLPGNTTTATNILTQTGTGAASAAPVWQTASAAGIAPFTFKPVTFSATPGFAFGSGATTFEITLTGNVTSSTVSGAAAGQTATFILCQDATGSRTFTWPTGFRGAMTIGSTASKCSMQSFVYDGTSYFAVAAGLLNQ
jgi:hypothetical protein